MKLGDIFVATVVGGVFHVEDAVFEMNVPAYITKLNAVVDKARKVKKIKHDYFVRSLDKDEAITEGAKLSLQCIDEKKVQIQISKKAVVLEIGALMKQNSLFLKDGYLRDAARLIDEIVKFRKPKKFIDVGIYPKFVIPFSSEVAPNHVRDLLFKTFDRDIGLPKVDQINGFSFIAKTLHKGITVESEVKTSNERSSRSSSRSDSTSCSN